MPLLGPFVATLAPEPWEREQQDLHTRITEIIGKDLQSRLRSRLDHGLYGSSALRAQATTVRSDAGRLEIHTKAREQQTSTVASLFQTNLEPPSIKKGRLVFKQIEMQDLKKQRSKIIKQTLKESVEMTFIQALTDTSKQIGYEKPIVE